MSLNTLSIVETAKIYGTTRNNIIYHLRNGRIKAVRGKERKRDWRVTPEMLTELAQSQFSGLLASLGIYLFSESLHKNNMLSDEAYATAKNNCREILKTAYEMEALTPIIDDMAANHEFIKELLNNNENSAA